MIAATPESDHLFTVRDEGETQYLPEEQAQNYHKSVSKILLMRSRSRQEIQTSVAFLTTHVKNQMITTG